MKVVLVKRFTNKTIIYIYIYRKSPLHLPRFEWSSQSREGPSEKRISISWSDSFRDQRKFHSPSISSWIQRCHCNYNFSNIPPHPSLCFLFEATMITNEPIDVHYNFINLFASRTFCWVVALLSAATLPHESPFCEGHQMDKQKQQRKRERMKVF